MKKSLPVMKQKERKSEKEKKILRRSPIEEMAFGDQRHEIAELAN